MFTKAHALICALFFSLISFTTNAQDQFERLHRSDRQNAAMDLITDGTNYYILSNGRDLDSTEFEYFTITQFDDKGTPGSSTDFSFEHKIIPGGELLLQEDGGFVISGLLDTLPLNKILMKVDGGEVIWTRGFGRNLMPPALPIIYPNNTNIDIDTTFREGFFVAGNEIIELNASVRLEIFLAEANADGNQLWAKGYGGDDLAYYMGDLASTPDSGAIIAGTVVNAQDSTMFLMKTDSIGNIEWSRTYTDSLDLNSELNELGTAVAPTQDGGYLLGGRKIDKDITDDHVGVLVKTDTFGNIEWSRNIQFNTSDTIIINNIIIAQDGDAVVSGNLLGINADDVFAFMLKIDMNGDLVWKQRYKAATRQFEYAGGLIENTGIGGFAYLTSSDEMGEQVGPYMIKSDNDGMTICDSVITQQLVFNAPIKADTLVLFESEILDATDVTVKDTMPYNGYSPLTVVLESFEHCVNESFSDTLDATTDGAIAYEWSTGETTPMIVVSEFGEYMVTVTIGVDYCYNLCATANVNQIDLPTVMPTLDNNTYCSQGTVQINGNIEGVSVSEATDSIVWSSGDLDVNSIVVDQEGNYMVTASNECGDASASIDVVFDMSPPDVNALYDDSLCTSGVGIIIATTSFPVNELSWSTGQSGSTIEITNPGEYTVTALSDFCEDGTASVTVEPCPVFYDIPNAFTPNGDDASEVFVPIFTFDPSILVEYEFVIYARWGGIVFETNNPLEGWDGTIDGEPAASDVYVYKINGLDNEGGDLQRMDDEPNFGDVTLVR